MKMCISYNGSKCQIIGKLGPGIKVYSLVRPGNMSLALVNDTFSGSAYYNYYLFW